jgi:FKBP-type peptidyl-prolyl cis-trans isomerase
MKEWNKILRVCLFAVFVSFLASSCLKTTDPYAAYTPAREAGLIKAWLDAQVAAKKNIDTTSTGIFYIRDKVGTGPNVKAGDSVKVIYTGKFTDGTVFDTSVGKKDGTYSYVQEASTSRMIQGWEEGIKVLNKGASATFLIPSAKAYGSGGYSIIPPNTPLIFVIEVVDIK